jgi:hypothetical protein
VHWVVALEELCPDTQGTCTQAHSIQRVAQILWPHTTQVWEPIEMQLSDRFKKTGPLVSQLAPEKP